MKKKNRLNLVAFQEERGSEKEGVKMVVRIRKKERQGRTASRVKTQDSCINSGGKFTQETAIKNGKKGRLILKTMREFRGNHEGDRVTLGFDGRGRLMKASGLKEGF